MDTPDAHQPDDHEPDETAPPRALEAGPPLPGAAATDESGGGETGEPGAGEGTATADSPPPRVLRRSSTRRILGGVAGGIADYLGVDPAFVRIAFVVLTVLGGSGVILYLAGWLLIPSESGEVAAQEWVNSRPRRRSAVVMLIGIALAVVALSSVFAAGPWWPHWNHGVGFAFGLFALTLAVVVIATSRRNRTAGSRGRWLLASALISVLALLVLAAASVFTIQALSGVPLSGGIGDTQWRPTNAARVSKNYQLAVGNLTVDLSQVTFRPGTTHVKATVGIGRVEVDVPPGTTVSVSAHSGLGKVNVFGRHDDGLGTRTSFSSRSDAPARPVHIVLDAEAGVGDVEVVRAD